MNYVQCVCAVAVLSVLATGGVASAAGTNAPAVSTKAPAQSRDYRAMLQRVRAKQEERNGLEEVQKAISTFQMRIGRLPAELTELVERGILPSIPPPPLEMRFVYDRIKGNVTLAPLPNAIGTPRSNVTGRANVLTPR
jgi:hypothetical protein